LAGLAVIGLKPVQQPLSYVVETDEGDVTGRYLTGEELRSAITEATSTTEYRSFSSYLMERGYSENRSGITGFMVESSGRTPVLHVTLSFANTAVSGEVIVKYLRHGSETETIMGILKQKNGTINAMEVYQAFPDRVEHTKTYARSGNSIIERPPGNSTSATAIYTADQLEEGVLVDKCNLCTLICGSVIALTCSAGAKALCTLICAAFSGPAAVACPGVCWVVTTVICVWLSNLSCPALCKKYKFCK